MTMQFKQEIRGRTFAANIERQGVFELVAGAYLQHRGNGQTPTFRDARQFGGYVRKHIVAPKGG